MSNSNKPLVGIVCCRKEIERHPFHVVGEKYIKAIHEYSDVTSVLIPSDDLSSMKSILNRLDGFLLTGSLSNVHPDRYSDKINDSEMLIDPARDEYVFRAVKKIIDMELPILAICRGFQEMNVIFGGSLYQSLENESDFKGHDFDRNASIEDQYDISHSVSFEEGGYLNQLTGLLEAEVNSLHGQGVMELGQGLNIEALSHGGLVEAFTIRDAAGFNLSVQWHPEWKPEKSVVSRKIFEAFGTSCQEYSERHGR
tara:strand:+ start:53 stop:814 length:762 start_codon:yes stop_codon:yes gene_type:complete